MWKKKLFHSAPRQTQSSVDCVPLLQNPEKELVPISDLHGCKPLERMQSQSLQTMLF